MKRTLLPALLAALLLWGCQSPTADSGAKNPGLPATADLMLTVVETSDLHGALVPYDFKTDTAKSTSLANVATLVNDYRARNKEVLLLDGGDNLQGQPLIYYYNFVATKAPNAFSQAMNALGYDAITVGNHDVETGHEVYDKVNAELKAGTTTPEGMLSANLVRETDGTPYFAPYKVVTKAGVKIAILGLTEPGFVKNFPKALYSGIKVEDMIDSAKKWIPLIQSKEKPDLIIGLFHAGVDYTYNGTTATTPMNENPVMQIIQQVAGLDAVFVGHDHQGWTGKGWDPVTKTATVDVKDPNGKSVPIYGALNEARKIPVVTMYINYDQTAKKYSVAAQACDFKDLSTVPADAAFTQKLASQTAEAKAWVSKKIGAVSGPQISSRDAMFGDSAFVDLIHKLQLDLTKDPASGLKPAQISFCAPLSANALFPSGTDGNIYVRDMFSLYVYENWMYTMDLTGQQVKDFLEVSYDGWFNQMKDDKDHLIAFSKDAAGNLVLDARTGMPKTKVASYNYDSAAGIVYDVDVSKAYGSRILIKSMADGSAFDPAKTYSVAINSYRAMGGGGLLEKGANIPAADLLAMKYVTSATTKDLRFYLTQYIEKQTAALAPQALGNWKVIPETWAAAGKALDYPLLYKTK